MGSKCAFRRQVLAFGSIVICLILCSITSASATIYVHDSSASFSWAPASGDVHHYNVYVSTNDFYSTTNGPFLLCATAPSNSSCLSVQDGKQYVVQVEAVNSYGVVGPLSDPSELVVVFLGGTATDTDGDGMPDSWEVSQGLNPYDPRDASQMSSTSGLTNYQLYVFESTPVARAGQNQVLNPAVVTLDGSASTDPNGDPLTYSWTQVQGVQVQLSDPAAVQPTFLARGSGDYVFQLVVNDGTWQSAPSQVTVHINNVQPTADAGPDQVVDAGTQVVLDGHRSSDPNGDALTYTWTLASGSPLSLQGMGSAQPSFTPTDSGVYRFQLAVSDGRLQSQPDSVQVVVNGTNHVPTANAGKDKVVPVNRQVILDGSGSSDQDGDALKYSWSELTGPVVVTLSDPSSMTPSFVPTAVGVYTFELKVFDGRDYSPEGKVTITALDQNHAPVALIGLNAPALVGDRVTLDGSASVDQDGDPLSYRWSQVSGPAVLLENADTATAGFYALSEGTLIFQLVVNDGKVDGPPDQTTVIVNGQDQVPVANAGKWKVVDLGSRVCLDGSGSYDPDAGDALSFSWSQVSGPLVTLYDAATMTPCLTPKAEGAYVFQLVVSDGKTYSAPAQVHVFTPSQGTLPPGCSVAQGPRPGSDKNGLVTMGIMLLPLAFILILRKNLRRGYSKIL